MANHDVASFLMKLTQRFLQPNVFLMDGFACRLKPLRFRFGDGLFPFRTSLLRSHCIDG